MGTGSFPEVKSSRGVTLTPHPLLVPWSWKGRAIPLLPLWAVRLVQSLSACTRVTFTFFLPTCQVELQFFNLLPTLEVCICVCSSTDDHQQDGAAPNTATHTALRESDLEHVICGEKQPSFGKNNRGAEFSNTSWSVWEWRHGSTHS